MAERSFVEGLKPNTLDYNRVRAVLTDAVLSAPISDAQDHGSISLHHLYAESDQVHETGNPASRTVLDTRAQLDFAIAHLVDRTIIASDPRFGASLKHEQESALQTVVTLAHRMAGRDWESTCPLFEPSLRANLALASQQLGLDAGAQRSV